MVAGASSLLAALVIILFFFILNLNRISDNFGSFLLE